MEIYIGADHNGFAMKQKLVPWLEEQGYSVTDEGPMQLEEADDYPDFGIRVAEAIGQSPDTRRGILLCGSGVGMTVVANKVKGVRAASIHNPSIAAAATRDDNLNIIALGADYIDTDTAKQVITSWLTTAFSKEDRHIRRIKKIAEYEQGK